VLEHHVERQMRRSRRSAPGEHFELACGSASAGGLGTDNMPRCKAGRERATTRAGQHLVVLAKSRFTMSRMTSRGVKCSPAVSLDSSENFRTSSS